MTAFLINTSCFKTVDSFDDNSEIVEIPEGNYEFFQSGTASWYGKKFHGRPTASGEIFDMYKISAAHKTIPLGTYILVVNKMNGKKIKVKVNDRGPFVKGRVLDLSYAAAKKLGYSELGLTEVDIYVYEKIGNECYSIQLGAFEEKSRAYNLSKKLNKKYNEKFYVVSEGDYFKVLCGKFTSRKKAENFQESNWELESGFIVSCK